MPQMTASGETSPMSGALGSETASGKVSDSMSTGSTTFPESLSTEGSMNNQCETAAALPPSLRNVTLSQGGRLVWLVRQVPMLLLYGLLAAIIGTAIFSLPAFSVIFFILNIHILFWMFRTGIYGIIGAGLSIPAACRHDWTKEIEETQGGYEVQHYVIIPSYKESFSVLDATVCAVAQSGLAMRCVRLVLAMEERDPEATTLAKQLTAKWGGHFLEMFWTIHPADLPMEVAGKSSNTNWAFQEVSRRARSLRLSPLRTVISVNDADCLWHPRYFEAVTLDVLRMSPEESQWLIWQAPQMQLRNHFDVPVLTRMTGSTSALSEISGLRCPFGTHICYSSYTMLLALADKVGGWDADVLAEDHHMFCKCFFASINAGGPEPRRPRLRLQPVFLPVKSFLVESAEGSNTVSDYVASLKARFVQARRHMQGVTEVSYVLLQWVETVRHWGFRQVPINVHVGIASVVWSMLCVHTFPFCHLTSVLLANFSCAKRLFGDTVLEMGNNMLHLSSPIDACEQLSGTKLQQVHCMIFMSVPYWFAIPAILLILGNFIVIAGFTRGDHMGTDAQGSNTDRSGLEANALLEKGMVCRSDIWHEERGGVPRFPFMQWRLILLLQCGIETVLFSWSVIIIFGFVPELLAVWHLARVGNQFKYICADKPAGLGGGNKLQSP